MIFRVEQGRLSDLNLITRLSGGWLSLPPSMILQPVSCSNCFPVLPQTSPHTYNISIRATTLQVRTDLLFVPHGALASHHHLAPSLLLQLLGCQSSGAQDSSHKIKLKKNIDVNYCCFESISDLNRFRCVSFPNMDF